MTIPMECRPCSSELVEVPEGQVQGIYRRLVFDNEQQPVKCPNCSRPLTVVLRAVNSNDESDLTRTAA